MVFVVKRKSLVFRRRHVFMELAPSSRTSIAAALRLLDLCSIEIIDHDYDGKPFATI